MSESSIGKRMKLGEFFAREKARARADYEALLAYEATPEGRDVVAARAAESARMRKAEEIYAIEHAVSPYDAGREAASYDQARDPPDDLSDDGSDDWLAGYDSIGSHHD